MSSGEGLTKSGKPDKRLSGQESEAHAANTEELAHGSHHASKVPSKEDPNKSAAQVGGEHSGQSQAGQEKYKPTEHGGLTKSGEPDKRVKGQESEAHRENAEELAHGSHHASKVPSKEDSSKSAAQEGGEKGGRAGGGRSRSDDE